MFAKMNEARDHVTQTSDGTQPMQEYGWKSLRELTREQRIADGWHDFIAANMQPPAFGFHSGGVSIVVDTPAGTVTEVQNPDIAMDAESIAKATADYVAATQQKLWEAADKYVARYISGVAIGLLTLGVIQSKPKAVAVTAWSSSVWGDYYTRKALIAPGVVTDFEFATYDAQSVHTNPMPHTVPELRVELGM